MNFAAALRLQPGDVVAFTGSGGKTTAMFALARALGGPVVVTTSTHLGAAQAALADVHFALDPADGLPALPDGVTLFSGPAEGDKLTAISVDQWATLRQQCKAAGIPLLVEADGARGRSLKSPAAHEPALPAGVDVVVVVAGLSVLGKPLDIENVHRPELVGELLGIPQGSEITPEMLNAVLLHPDGGRKLPGLPAGARTVALLNQADDDAQIAAGGKLARSLLDGFDAVLVAQAHSGTVWLRHERIAGIVLAGGGSERMGEPKQLLSWRGHSFVRTVAQTALAAGCHPVVLVTGAAAEQVAAEVADLDVSVVHNAEWHSGQSSSMKAALRALPQHVGGAVFFLVDQPQTPPELVRALVDVHRTEPAPIIVPLADGRRANPTLFDAALFPELLEVEGNQGGRALFSKYSLQYVEWVDAVVALDVDTLEDYNRLLNYEND